MISIFILPLLFKANFTWAEGEIGQSVNDPSKENSTEFCLETMKTIPGKMSVEELKEVCAETKAKPSCKSQNGHTIYHYDRMGSDPKGKRILALSLIHGDEGRSGEVTRAWIRRLARIEPRNSWRVIPVANPDGFKNRKRVNENGVDLNRNFPTKEWDEKALAEWRANTKSDPRRYPGKTAVSEPETKCILEHFEDFKPDFVISIHTPLGVLDFDGPRVKVPKLLPLPWSPLGNFPGSLGRYLWHDKNVPVLTIELRGNVGMSKLEELDRLQDVSGTLAIEAKNSKTSVKK